MNSITVPLVAGRALDIEGTYNFRSTAGYEATAGVIRPHSLLRSDALHRLSANGISQFAAQGIVRVIDLRDATELQSSPSVLTAVEVVHHPIFAGAAMPSGATVPSLEEIYRLIATERVTALVGAVRLIAEAPEGGVLVHCTAGKDRTGMVVATALTAVGVPREQVLADYAASAENLAGEWANSMLTAYAGRIAGPVDEAVRELVSASPAEALDSALEVIDAQYGGVEPMLLNNGLDAVGLERLRSRLVA
ncbi:tyrosine-protein phosphatase [Dietzia sp. B19]|uniref:tyrosine-protein phosphatase n=1 Tax=Actinomycetes TaxID=1760 RepID=UPI0015FABB85|nr:tyrosine-protein phosphatase [Dietzia sp. B19]MBB1056555.1 tyrosine-protein phosphatase [Dietzia sp. B19]